MSTYTAEEVSKIIAAAEGQDQMLYALLAGTGMRIREALALEVQDICGTRITVRSPKTANDPRQVEVHCLLASLLKEHIGDRQSGFVFQNASGTPLWRSYGLTCGLHRILATMGLERRGFYEFRRFRLTHLVQNGAPQALVQFWMDCPSKMVTDLYSKVKEDVAFRTREAERVGLGFQISIKKPYVN